MIPRSSHLHDILKRANVVWPIEHADLQKTFAAFFGIKCVFNQPESDFHAIRLVRESKAVASVRMILFLSSDTVPTVSI